MNQGGAPKGKRAATLHKEQVQRELADPSLRHARVQADKDKKRAFVGLFVQQAPKRGRKEKNSGESDSLDLDHQPADDDERVHAGGSACAPAASDPAAPPLPKKLADRQEGVVYTYIHQGVDRLVTTSGRNIYCTCQGGAGCKGGLQIIKCKGINNPKNNPTSAAALTSPALAPRQRTEHNYAAMSTGKSESRPTRAMTAGEQEFFGSVTSIASTSTASGVVVMEDGMWSKELLDHPAWSVSTHGVHFPLRVGAKWRKTFTGKHAEAVNESSTTICFDIARGAFPEQPSFRARSFLQGPFATQFQASNVNDLERKWLSQNNNLDVAREQLSNVQIHGSRFVGFDNVNLATHFIDVTPDFEAQKSEHSRALKEGSISHRQLRRRVAAMMSSLDGVLAQGHKDREEAFKLLIQSAPFKHQFGDLMQFHFCGVTTQGLVESYKACIQKGQYEQARLLLSTFSSTHTRAQTMMRFGCSERQAKAANWTFRLRNVPADTRKVVKWSTYRRETVEHFENWALNPKVVMRAAGGKAAFLLRANRNCLFLQYKDDCQMDGITGMGRTNFYKFYAESIFKQMTRVCLSRLMHLLGFWVACDMTPMKFCLFVSGCLKFVCSTFSCRRHAAAPRA